MVFSKIFKYYQVFSYIMQTILKQRLKKKLQIIPRSAQAAMEFLMTYGWALLVILAVIGALAYFGIINPSRFLPSKCILATGFSCAEYKIGINKILLSIENNLGVDLTSLNITINSTGGSDVSCNQQNNVNGLANGARTPLLEFCSYSGDTNKRFKGIIKIRYTKTGETLYHTVTGEISGPLEE